MVFEAAIEPAATTKRLTMVVRIAIDLRMVEASHPQG
jgi:hypothetical protein